MTRKHTIIAAVLAIATTPAHATGYGRMTLLPGEGACFAYVEIRNTAGVYNRTETLDTEEGPVLIEYETVGGHNASDHDIVTVVDMPSGVAASPWRIELPDGDTGLVCLMLSVGM